MPHPVYILFATLLYSILTGCKENSKKEEFDLLSAKAEKIKAEETKRIEEEKQIEEFKKTIKFTLHCEGNYALTIDGKTRQGTQSFGVTIDPKELAAHYFGFSANGSYNRFQRETNNEVLAVKNVDENWIQISNNYRFNRRTLKYEHSQTSTGLCVKQKTVRNIPNRSI